MNLQRLALILFALPMLAIAACASGSAIVTGNTRTPIAPELVKIYLEPPASFEVIGLVNASSDTGWIEQGSMDYAIEELKKRAAKPGANGVLLVSSGDKTTTVVDRGTTYVFNAKTVKGRAIFVKGQ